MKNGQKEPFQPIQESALGTEIKDDFGSENSIRSVAHMVSVSAWAADLSQPTVTDVEAAALLVWGSLLHLLPGKMSPLAEVTAEFSPIEIHHKKKNHFY